MMEFRCKREFVGVTVRGGLHAGQAGITGSLGSTRTCSPPLGSSLLLMDVIVRLHTQDASWEGCILLCPSPVKTMFSFPTTALLEKSFPLVRSVPLPEVPGPGIANKPWPHHPPSPQRTLLDDLGPFPSPPSCPFRKTSAQLWTVRPFFWI